MNIMRAGMQDLPDVCRIVRDATRHMDERGIPQWDTIYPSEAILQHDIEKQHMLLILVDGRTAGLVVVNEEESAEYADILWHYSGKVMAVHRLTIDPAYQGRGLATKLMDFAEGMAATEGYRCIRLDAFTQNAAAVALYENRGYRRAGTGRFRKGLFFCYEKPIGPTGLEDRREENGDLEPGIPAGETA